MDGGESHQLPSPLITGVSLRINGQLLAEFTRVLTGLLHDSFSDDFHKLRTIIDELQMPEATMVELVTQVIRGNGVHQVNMARNYGIPIDRLAFFANYLSRPIRQSCGTDHVDDWRMGYCPVCGLWPRLSHISTEDGHRQLWCIGCDTVWAFPRLLCPFCLETDQSRLGYLKIAETDVYRVYVCETCRRYLKTIIGSSPLHSRSGNLDEQYLLTAALDSTAAFEKYIQDFVGFAAFDLQDNAAARRYIAKAMNQNQQ